MCIPQVANVVRIRRSCSSLLDALRLCGLLVQLRTTYASHHHLPHPLHRVHPHRILTRRPLIMLELRYRNNYRDQLLKYDPPWLKNILHQQFDYFIKNNEHCLQSLSGATTPHSPTAPTEPTPLSKELADANCTEKIKPVEPEPNNDGKLGDLHFKLRYVIKIKRNFFLFYLYVFFCSFCFFLHIV